MPDSAAVLEACYAAVVRQVHAVAGGGVQRLVIGGKSMGGRIASQVVARDPEVAGAVEALVFLGYPPRKPMLFVQGSRDAFGTPEHILGGIARWINKTITVLCFLYAPVALAADTARLPAPGYPSVIRLVESGKATEALAELDRQLRDRATDPPLEGLVLRAELLCQTKQFRDCAAFWDQVGRREPALQRLAYRRSITALIDAGDRVAALDRLGPSSAREPARRDNDLRLRAASALRAAGEPRRAVELCTAILAVVPKGDLADAARLERAAALEAAGDVEAAVGSLRLAQRMFVDPRTFIRARDEERRLENVRGRTPEPFSEAEYRAIEGRLRSASRFAEANDALMAWRRAYPQSASLDEIDAAVIENLYRLRANDEARVAILTFVTRYPSSPHVARARVTEFRLDVREGRTGEVKAHGRALWDGREGRLTATARRSVGVTLANYLVSVGDAEGGLAIYRELHRASARRAERIETLLRAGVAAIRAGQYARAESNLRAIDPLRPGPATSAAAAYWLSAAEARLGRRDRAIARLQDLADRAPWSYAGVRAEQLLRALGAQPRLSTPLVFPPPELQPATIRLPEYRAATILAQAGLTRDAAVTARDLAARAWRDPAVALLAARASDAAGEHRAALRMLTGRLSPYLQKPSDGAPSDLLALAYPRAFWDEVRARAAEHRVDPLLLLAIMRRESRFDPEAVSAAGAMGLFQIMPYTAEELAPEAGVEASDEDTVLTPRANVTLAARLVSNLSALFSGAPVPIVASFNAGEDRVQVWWDAAKGIDEALFVETIPYAETRAYVKEVYVNYLMYKKLY